MAMAIGMALNSQAQNINGVKLADLKASYIELREVRKLYSDKKWIWMDYGQKINEEEDAYIKDDKGVEQEYNSALDCVNKMKALGYDLHQVYVRNGSDKYYVLKRAGN